MMAGLLSKVPRHALWLAATAAIGPILVLTVLFNELIGGLVPGFGARIPGTEGVAIATPVASLDRFAQFVSDFSAREAFGLTSGFMVIVYIAGLVYAVISVGGSRGRTGALLTAAAALATMVVGIAFEGNPMRDLLIDRVFAKAAAANYDFGQPDFIGNLEGFLTLTLALGYAAVGALVALFAEIALGPAEDRLSVAALRHRQARLRNAVMAGGVVLTVATAATYQFYHLPVALIAPPYQEHYARLASLAATHWGTIYTCVLITASAPAAFSVLADTMEAARRAAPDNSHRWTAENDLAIAPMGSLRAATAILAPLASGPVIDLLKALSAGPAAF